MSQYQFLASPKIEAFTQFCGQSALLFGGHIEHSKISASTSEVENAGPLDSTGKEIGNKSKLSHNSHSWQNDVE